MTDVTSSRWHPALAPAPGRQAQYRHERNARERPLRPDEGFRCRPRRGPGGPQ
jgi:hypothetical protein